MALVVTFTVLTTTACTLNIAQLHLTPRDNETYNNPYLKQYLKFKKDQSIISIAIVPKTTTDYSSTEKQEMNLLGDYLKSTFSKLNNYQLFTNSDLGAISEEENINNLQSLGSSNSKNYTSGKVDFIITYDVVSTSYIAKEEYQFESNENNYTIYYGQADVSFSRWNHFTQSQKSNTLTGTSTTKSRNQNIELIDNAIENAVKQYVSEFAIDSALGVVLQTKGSGKVALIDIGSGKGIMKGMKVTFFYREKRDGQIIHMPFAYGNIIQVEKNTAWVEVADFKKAGVKINNFVKISPDQSETVITALNQLFGN